MRISFARWKILGAHQGHSMRTIHGCSHGLQLPRLLPLDHSFLCLVGLAMVYHRNPLFAKYNLFIPYLASAQQRVQATIFAAKREQWFCAQTKQKTHLLLCSTCLALLRSSNVLSCSLAQAHSSMYMLVAPPARAADTKCLWRPLRGGKLNDRQSFILQLALKQKPPVSPGPFFSPGPAVYKLQRPP